jgi:alkylated DNA repair dioxygenase AlkB
MRRPASRQPDLFADGLPDGFAYQPDVVSAEQERRILDHIAGLPFRPFEFHGYVANRRVVSFGWRYDFAGRALTTSEPVPAFLLPLRDLAASFAGLEANALQQLLVTEYPPGAGIGWHRDRPEFGDVIAFSFLSPCTLRFRRRGPQTERRSLWVAPRSAYLLRGASRREWEHSIPPLGARRFSATFRSLAA